MPDGSIDIGPLGRLVVAGMNLEHAEATIHQIAVSRGWNAAVNVRLIQPVHSFYVVGAVNSPGAYPLAGHETVLDALMKAGGLTEQASACDILLARPTSTTSCRVALPICYRAITQLGDTSTNYHLQPGDRIVVARQSKFEEVFGFLSIPTRCDHCSCPAKACCDPNTGTYQSSEFAPTPSNYYPTAQPANMSAAGQSANFSNEPPEPARQGHGARLLNPLPPDPTNRNRLDGELDFESEFQPGR
jgi:hypothetical protein